jgi:NLI interacting factor-like phosphatase
VLDLDDVLVHSDWSRARGWRTFKRPGAEDFLRTMSQFYEVVVYTSQLPTYADPILDRLDPQRYIAYRHVPPAGPFPCLASMCTWAPACPGPAWQMLQRGPSSLNVPVQAVPQFHAVQGRQARARPVQAEPGPVQRAAHHQRSRCLLSTAGQRNQGWHQCGGAPAACLRPAIASCHAVMHQESAPCVLCSEAVGGLYVLLRARLAMAALSCQQQKLLTHQHLLPLVAGLQLEAWKLDAEDTALLDHLPFLEAIVRSGVRAPIMLSATQGCQQDGCIAKRPQIRRWIKSLPFPLTGVPDVRSVIRSYDAQDIPTAFRERMAKLQTKSKTKRGFLGSFSGH